MAQFGIQEEVATLLPHISQNRVPRRKENAFDWLFAKRFATISRIILRHWTVSVIVLVILTLLIANTYVVSFTGDVIGGFYTIILADDAESFPRLVMFSSLVICGSALLMSTIQFVVELFAWISRKHLQNHLHERYFINTLYYKVGALSSRVDNPDQRITQDVNQFCITLSTVIEKCVSAPLIILYYTFTCWNLIGWFALVIVYLYFFIGYILNKLIMSVVAKLVFQQEKLEGDFRFGHIRVRTFAESIAMYDGGDCEKFDSDKTFRELLNNKLKIVKWQYLLNSSSNIFTYVGSIVNYVIVALPVLYFHSHTDTTALYVAKATFSCIMLISGFSQFMNGAADLSDLAGYTGRVADLLETLKELDENDFTEHQGIMAYGDTIKFENVTCYTPTGIKLVEKLNFSIVPGCNVLIMGPTGCGKSSIVRLLNGLWPFFKGSITKPGDEQQDNLSMFYLPQRPYLFVASLIDLVTYPQSNSGRNIEQIRKVVKELLIEVQLSHLLNKYNLTTPANWPDILSPGEQQLISFARLFYHTPKFAVVDEATSSLDEDMEEYVYTLCSKKNITMLSVGHRSTLKQFHHRLLQIDRDREHHFTTLRE